MSQKPPAIAACLLPLNLSGNDIQLLPAGEFDAPAGSLLGKGPWKIDAQSAGRVIQKAAARKNDILIDYEHQSLTASRTGIQAPAAGWISPSSIIWRDDGLFAQGPDWKERAAALIAADEYRYLSPVFTYDPATGEVLSIISVALTNTPAIDGMAAVAAAMASFTNPEETAMDPSELMEMLCYMLNLPLTTTVEEMKVELEKVKAMLPVDGTGAVAATTLPALISQQASEIAALKSAVPDPAQYVPIAAFNDVNERLRKALGEPAETKVAALIAANPSIITPAMKAWAESLGKQDINLLQNFIDQSAPIAALTAPQTQGKTPLETKPVLQGEELAVCSALGVSQEAFLNSKASNVGA